MHSLARLSFEKSGEKILSLRIDDTHIHTQVHMMCQKRFTFSVTWSTNKLVESLLTPATDAQKAVEVEVEKNDYKTSCADVCHELYARVLYHVPLLNLNKYT